MKFLIVFACALAAVSAQYIEAGSHYSGPAVSAEYIEAGSHYSGPQHIPVINHEGVPVDTADVQHAQATHHTHKINVAARNGDHVVAPVVAHAPVVHHPVAHAPLAHHPEAHYPVAHAPVVHHPGTHVPVAHHPEAHAPVAHYPVAHAPVVHHPGTHVPVVHHPVAHAPVAPVVHHPIQHHPTHHADHAYPTTGVAPAHANGVPLETPEVLAAKAYHFAAHHEALARTGYPTAVVYRRRRGVYAPLPVAYHAAYPYAVHIPYGYAHHY